MNKKLMIIIGILLIPCIILATILVSKKKEANKDKKSQVVVWEEGQNVNEPILLEGMKAITFEEGKETPKILKKEECKQGIWYDYKAQEKEEEQGVSKWANAMTDDRKYVGLDPKICIQNRLEQRRGRNTEK